MADKVHRGTTKYGLYKGPSGTVCYKKRWDHLLLLYGQHCVHIAEKGYPACKWYYVRDKESLQAEQVRRTEVVPGDTYLQRQTEEISLTLPVRLYREAG